MRLIIGSANFGSNYGISGKKNLSFNEIEEIIKIAIDNNVREVDTAVDYIDSHKIINNIRKFDTFKVITKINSDKLIGINNNLLNIINTSFKSPRVKVVLIHNQDFYTNKNGKNIYLELLKLKNEGEIEKIGVSVYDYEHANNIINNFDIDILQVPFNPFNQEFTKNRIEMIRSISKIELHCRSIFLQGLLLSQINSNIYQQYLNIFKYWNEFLKRENICALEYCINYVKINKFDGCVVGVRTGQQLHVIANQLNKFEKEIPDFNYEIPRQLYDPRVWKY